MKQAKMSIGAPVATIPGTSRKQRKTRMTIITRALAKAAPGTILPIYMGSAPSAANLAMLLRKAGKDLLKQVVVRKHIVYVQKAGDTPIASALASAGQDVIATEANT